MWEATIVDLGIVEILGGTADYADAFNFFFTLIWVFGLVSMSVALLMRVITRS